MLLFCFLYERTFLTKGNKYDIINVLMGGKMNFYKELFYILFEMFFSIFIIIFGYFIWDNFDTTELNIAKYNDATKAIDLVYESNIDKGIPNNNSIICFPTYYRTIISTWF